jgi:hypothetical protein
VSARNDFSEAAFLEFLRESAVSGVVKPATGRARKLAAEQLLGQLKSHERLDLRQLDVDELCSRFHKLQGSTIRPENLQVYNERLGGALQDFLRWTEHPTQFISTEGELSDVKKVANRDDAGQAAAREQIMLNPPRSPHEIFPVPLRHDLVVYLHNIPLDMTAVEAQKIAAIVQALALPNEEE